MGKGNILIFSALAVFILALSYFIYQSTSDDKLGELSKALLPSVATLLTALAALSIYKNQQEDERTRSNSEKQKEKENFAATIYMEIKSAQEAIEKIRNDNLEKSTKRNIAIHELSPQILHDQSWSKCRHLFIRDLSPEHYEIIDSSFEAAIQAEDCRNWAIDLFRKQTNQKAIARIDAMALISKELVMAQVRKEDNYEFKFDPMINKLNIKNECEKQVNELIDLPSYTFIPTELCERGDQALGKFKNVINTPAGEALKILAAR